MGPAYYLNLTKKDAIIFLNKQKGESTVRRPFILPGFGLRSAKTALSATFLAAVYYLFDRNPTFACIGAVFGMGSDLEDSWRHGGNRLIGTIIGGLIGLFAFWMEHQFFPGGNHLLRLLLLFMGILFLAHFSVICGWPNAVQPGGVVLAIILFSTPDNHISYAINRMIDTGIGVVVSMLLNHLMPRHLLKAWLGKLRRKSEEEIETKEIETEEDMQTPA